MNKANAPRGGLNKAAGLTPAILLSGSDSRIGCLSQRLIPQDWQATGTWANFALPLTLGEHTISFGVEKGNYNQTGFGVVLDNLIFEVDTDGDGVGDSRDNCPTRHNPWQFDDDGDGQGNECDPLPFDPAPPTDSDGDGLSDYVDNCPQTANPDQLDTDNDGLGDACDDTDDRPQDTDEDGIPDYADNCPVDVNPEQSDVDWDGLGDACDASDDRPIDTDGDGYFDVGDNCPAVPNPGQEDLDGDNLGDACDNDIDGDGIENDIEDQYTFLDAHDPADALQDQDGDGASNLYELNQGGDPQTPGAYATLDLSEYATIVEGQAVYSGERLRLVFDNLYMPETDTYLRITRDQSEEYAVTEQGLELIASGNIFLNSHSNDLVVPRSMIEGQVLVIEDVHVTEEYYFGGDPQAATSKTISMVSRGEFELEGQTYATVTFEYQTGNSDFTYRQTFAEGIGLVVHDGLVLTRLVPLQVPADEPAMPTPPEEVEHTPDNSKSGGSLSFGGLVVMILCFGLFRRRYKA